VLYQHALYVIGYSHAVKEQRTFSVARMQDLKLTEDRFALPPDYSTRERFRDLFGLVEDKPHHIVLHVDATLAHLFEEAQWHQSQEVIRLKDGGVEVRFTAGGLEEIAWWVMSYGEAVIVVDPPELVQLVKGHLKNALKRY
jgi:predicted DNA-binding transcriptional regulator YafY